MGGRSAPMNEEQRREAEKTVIGEFSAVKHVKGVLSMGRFVYFAKEQTFPGGHYLALPVQLLAQCYSSV